MIADTPNRRRGLVAPTLAAVSALMLFGCNGDRKPVTQLAAKVNADEISVHQVNNALPATGVPPEQAEAARRAVLDRLIYQQLAVQQAIEQKLDRSPDVVMAIDAARRDILTRAYFGKVAEGLTKPDADEARKYYAEHPELFAQRRIFALQEIALAPGAVETAALREAAAHKSLEEVAAWLKSRNVRFVAKTERRSAEQLAPEVLTRLQTLKEGQTTVVELPRSTAVIRLAGSAPAPVDEDAALQPIQKLLAAQQAREAIALDIERLRTRSKIEYLNEFAGSEGAANRPSLAVPAGSGREPVAVNLEKGVAALK